MMQCRAEANPFFYGRFEHEHNPTLYVPDTIIRWASRRPIRFEGVRGSGKSSALRLLSWDVAWKVSPINTVGSTSALSFLGNPKHVGVYYRVEDVDVPLWDRWRVSRDIAQRYFATYVEFLYLDLLLDALTEIRKKDRTLFTERSAESHLVEFLLKECFSQKNRPHLLNLSFISLREVVGEVHRGIRQLVFQDASEEETTKTYSTVGPGYLLKQFGNEFERCYPHMADWAILILLDDCNFLTKWQAIVLNTAIANCKKPISYKLSSLAGMYPTLETMDKERPVILDNMDIEMLPNQSIYSPDAKGRRRGIQYVTIVNQICKARINEHFGKDSAAEFEFKELLGSFSLEDVLAKKLGTSENKIALELLTEAKNTAVKGRIPSITGTWLTQKRVREYNFDKPNSEDASKRRIRHIASIYKRKWNHVAAIALCKEFGLEFPYCGHKMVLHLSSGSIREMLRIMSMIWDEVGQDIQDFLKQCPVSQKIQAQGILKAAQARFDLVDSNVLLESGVTLQRICDRLGSLFSKCQSFPYILTTPETASISISLKSIDSQVEDIIRKGVVSGWLFKKIQDDHIYVGLHPILAPRFGISFRNPFFYPEPVSEEIVKALFLGSDSEARRAEKVVLNERIGRFMKRHNRALDQMEIPFRSK